MFPKGTKAQEIKREKMEDWQGENGAIQRERERELGRLWKFQK